MKARRSSYDAVIVGGGHNGLVAAAYLARAGRSCLLLERGLQLGGAAVSEGVFPGVAGDFIQNFFPGSFRLPIPGPPGQR